MAAGTGAGIASPGILAINNGRPFAWIERLEPTAHGGATRIYVYGAAHALARYQAESDWAERGMESSAFETPRGGWGRFLGMGDRHARRCVADLVRHGLVDPFGRMQYTLHARPLELRDEGKLGLRLELGPMAMPGWNDGMRAAWIALCSFAGADTLQCFPGVATLTDRARLDRRNLQRALRRIESSGFLRVEQRQRSSLYTLCPDGGYRTPAPPLPDVSAAPTGRERRPNRTPAPPKLEPLTTTSNMSPLTALAKREGHRSSGLINEDSPEVKRKREQARLAREGKALNQTNPSEGDRMSDERRIPNEWVRGATLDEAGELVTKEFDEDECYSAWYVFSVVRDMLEANGSEFPRDPSRAMLFAACEWTRMLQSQQSGGRTH